MNRFLRVFSILITAIFFSTSISLAFVSPADYEKIKKAKKDKTVQLEKKRKLAGRLDRSLPKVSGRVFPASRQPDRCL